MSRRPSKPKAFDLTLSTAERETLAADLAREIEDALNSRSAVIADGGLIDLYDWFYEQGRSNPEDRPFPGAADLTSYFITENVDALRSRLMKAIFGVRPFCFVEGWGRDAERAPFVEEFHDWQSRKSGLKEALARTVHGALIEDGYILEVSEKIETRRIVETIEAKLDLTPDGQPIFDLQGAPKIAHDDVGDPVVAQPGEASASIERTSTKTKRLGAQYDAISLKDFVFLPGHAKSQAQVWGYAYRLWLRTPEIEERGTDGVYEADAVRALGTSSDREAVDVPTPVADVAPQYGPSTEKELFQVSFKRDLDGDGREEWYLATLSVKERLLLRLKLDTFVMQVGRPRCVPFILFPRRESVYGYSYSEKLLTLAEEHTALRNMTADRSAMATNAPMTKLRSSTWDPRSEPIGVGRVINVTEHNEIKQLQIADVPQSAFALQNILHQAKERVGGLADSFVGVLANEARTLGENRLVAGGSAVRVDEVVGHLHMAIAEVMTLTHAVWLDTLKAEPRGVPAPTSVMDGLKSRGIDAPEDGRFTLAHLQGDFQFEPYGSDDTANPDKQRADFNASLEALLNLAKAFPSLQAIFQNREAARAVVQEWARRYNVRNRQPFMGAFDAPPVPAATGPAMGAPMMQGAPPPPQGQGLPAPALGGAAPPNIADLLAQLTGAPGAAH